jgi:small subunit ribosomal protein S6
LEDDLRDLGITQEFTKLPGANEQITESAFIYNVANGLKENISQHLIKIFQE